MVPLPPLCSAPISLLFTKEKTLVYCNSVNEEDLTICENIFDRLQMKLYNNSKLSI